MVKVTNRIRHNIGSILWSGLANDWAVFAVGEGVAEAVKVLLAHVTSLEGDLDQARRVAGEAQRHLDALMGEAQIVPGKPKPSKRRSQLDAAIASARRRSSGPRLLVGEVPEAVPRHLQDPEFAALADARRGSVA